MTAGGCCSYKVGLAANQLFTNALAWAFVFSTVMVFSELAGARRVKCVIRPSPAIFIAGW